MMACSDGRRLTGQGSTPPPQAGGGTAPGEARISALRTRIDELDTVLIGLLQQRARLSAEVQHTRVAHDGRPLAPDREQEVRIRFLSGLGVLGSVIADAVLSLCRGSADAQQPEPVHTTSGGET